MAIVQISRIQIRRGKKNNGTGFPQLASGELGWAIDTQELFIGNGSVAEGAPAVGNTKIMTERDFVTENNMLALVQHIYKVNNPSISTGSSPNNPISRLLQDRLDDRVTTTDFGSIGDFVADDTAALQRAINQLFLNDSLTESYNNTVDGIKTRIILELPPGKFKINSTLYIPSYATLVGAGSDKTILYFTGTTGPVIKFVNDSSIPGSPDLETTYGNTQPKQVLLKGMSIFTQLNNITCFQMNSVKDSAFEDLIIQGNPGNISNNSKGISLDAISDIVTCEHNYFNRVWIEGFTYGIFSNKDIINNTFIDCYVNNVREGVNFGNGIVAGNNIISQLFGPRNNIFSNCLFTNVRRQAINIEFGTGNIVENIKLKNVGNDGGSYATITYPQIYFGRHGNIARDIVSDRFNDLGDPELTVKTQQLTLDKNITASKGAYVIQSVSGAYGYLANDVNTSNTITLINVSVQQVFNTTNVLTIGGDALPSNTNETVRPTIVGTVQTKEFVPYVPEICGFGTYQSPSTREPSISLAYSLTTIDLIKLPVNADKFGGSIGGISHVLDYVYNSSTKPFSRRGKLSVGAYIDADTASSSRVSLTDEFDFIGDDGTTENSIKLDLQARLVDKNGNSVTLSSEGPFSIIISYTNTWTGDTGILSYSYSSSF